MNRNLEKALRDQKTRRQTKKIVESSRDNNILQEENLYKTFVEPFKNVFSALKITTKEILSNAMMVAGQVLTLSPEKQKERMQRYENRQSKIAAEWKPVMDRVDQSLSTGDADIVALAFSPGLYAVSALGASTYNAAEGVGGFLDTLGLKKGLFALLPGVDASTVTTPQKEKKPSDDKSSLLDKLNRLFIGTAIGAPIAKGVIDKLKKEEASLKLGLVSESTGGNFKKDFQDYLQDTGLDREFEKMQESLLEYYSDVIQEIDSLFDLRKDFVERVSNAGDMDALLEELKLLKQKDEDLSAEAQKIERAYEEAKEKLVNSKEFVQTAKEELNKEALTKEEIEKLADKALYVDFMKEVKENFRESLQNVKNELSKELESVLPTNKTLDMIKKTKSGLKLFNMIRDAKSKYNIS